MLQDNENSQMITMELMKILQGETVITTAPKMLQESRETVTSLDNHYEDLISNAAPMNLNWLGNIFYDIESDTYNMPFSFQMERIPDKLHKVDFQQMITGYDTSFKEVFNDLQSMDKIYRDNARKTIKPKNNPIFMLIDDDDLKEAFKTPKEYTPNKDSAIEQLRMISESLGHKSSLEGKNIFYKGFSINGTFYSPVGGFAPPTVLKEIFSMLREEKQTKKFTVTSSETGDVATTHEEAELEPEQHPRAKTEGYYPALETMLEKVPEGEGVKKFQYKVEVVSDVVENEYQNHIKIWKDNKLIYQLGFDFTISFSAERAGISTLKSANPLKLTRSGYHIHKVNEAIGFYGALNSSWYQPEDWTRGK